MKNILEEIVKEKRLTIAEQKKNISLYEMRLLAKRKLDTFFASRSLRKKSWSLIAECKLNSPAKGRLCQRYSVETLAKVYENNGASMLSIHTDKHFLGCNEDLQKVRSLVNLPIMRKDFVIDEYQIYEARYLGANCILLIARLMSAEQLKEFLFLTWSLGMDALIEIHDEEDLAKALSTPAEFLGINNRNLKDFTTSIENTLKLVPQIQDKQRKLISESGILSVEDIQKLKLAGCDGVLVGEGLVRSDNLETIAKQTALFSKL